MPVLSPGMSITHNELAHVDNAFEGHRGRPGQRGGSLPRSAGSYSGGDTGSDYSSNPPPIHREHRPHSYRTQSYPSTPSYIGSSEVDRRIAAGLESDDPEIRVRAKAAKAQRELLHTLPPPLSVAQTEQLKREATNPLSKVPEMKEGESFTDHALRSFVYAMESLDKPGRIVRGALGGRAREIGNIIPFSDYLGITKAEQAVSGRDLLQKIGIVGPNVEGFDVGDVAGFIVDAFTDPLMYVGGIGAISKSAQVAKITRAGVAAKNAAKIEAAGKTAADAAYRAFKRSGKSVRAAKGAATRARKVAEEEFLDGAFARAKSRARAAKPVKGGIPDSVKAKAAKTGGEAAAAAARKAVSSGRVGGTPAAAAMMLLDAVSKLPIAGELIRRVRTRVGRKLGVATARTRDKVINPTVKFLGREFKTGVKKPTTVGALLGKANKATLGHPKFKKTKVQLQSLAKYANQAHAAGKTFLEATGVADQVEREKAAKRAAYHDLKFKELTGNSLTINTRITANISGSVRREKWKGREYLVAPMSLIVEGVLNGSKGPLHYPMSEIKQNFSAWNGTPIVINHPTDKNGRPLRAQGNTEVLAKSIGVVRNASIKHPKLVAEGWFDVEKTKEVEPRVFNALSQGKPVELSTGLHTDNEPATNGAHWNGRSYTHVARNYRPDHLAILPDQVGACSINDGCGVLVNTENMKTTGRRSTNVEDLRGPNEYQKSVKRLPKRLLKVALARGRKPRMSPAPTAPSGQRNLPLDVGPSLSLADKIRHERDTRAYAKPSAVFDEKTGTFNKKHCDGCNEDAPCEECSKLTVNGWIRRGAAGYGAAGGATLGGLAGGAIGGAAGYAMGGVQGAKDGAMIGGAAGGLAGIVRGGGEGLATGTALEEGFKLRPKFPKSMRRKKKKPAMKDTTLNAWARKLGTAGGAAGGGLLGAAAGSATGAIGGAIAGLTSGHGLAGAAKGALGGAAIGGLAGGTAGAVGGGASGYVASTPADLVVRGQRKVRKKTFGLAKRLVKRPISTGTPALNVMPTGQREYDPKDIAQTAGTLAKHVLKRGVGVGVGTGLVDTGIRKLRKVGVKYRTQKVKKPAGYVANNPSPVDNLSQKDKNRLSGGALSGAAIGAGRGALVGSFAGPAGTALGAAGGATVGAATGALGSYAVPKLVSEFKRSRLRKKAVKKAKALIEPTSNEWSDEARAASLAVRQGRAQKKFEEEQNFSHKPSHHQKLADAHRMKAMQARRGGFLRKPDEEKALEHEAIARLHEKVQSDPAYHAREAEYHKQVQLESEGKAKAGSGSYVSKGLHIGGYGAAGGVAGVVGGHLAGKAIGRTVGALAGAGAAKIGGGIAGASLGTLVGGLPGGIVGGAIGSSLGKALAKPAGIIGGTAVGSIAGKATGIPGAGLAGGALGYMGSRFGSKKAGAALGKAAQKIASVSPEAAAWGSAVKGAAQTVGQVATGVSRAATQGAAATGAAIGQPLAIVGGEVLGGIAGTASGAAYGYGKAKLKAAKKHENQSARDNAKYGYHSQRAPSY